MSDRPLPYGWIKELDAGSGHHFYVDTKANPPRSIWVHPLDDEQYLKEHPEAREKASIDSKPTQQYSAPSTPPVASPAGSSSSPSPYATPGGLRPEKRGLFGKLKDQMVGTKEEREQDKRHKAEQKRQLMELRERRHQEELRAQAEMYQRQQQQQQQMYAQQAQYMQQHPQQFQPQYQYAQPQAVPSQRSGFGGGAAMPLLGGLAGGLLLGELIGGDDGGFGGDDGGGDW